MTRLVNGFLAFIVLTALLPHNLSARPITALNVNVQGATITFKATYRAKDGICPKSTVQQDGSTLNWVITPESCGRAGVRSVTVRDRYFLRFGRLTTLAVYHRSKAEPILKRPMQVSGLTFVHFASLAAVVTVVIALLFRWFFE